MTDTKALGEHAEVLLSNPAYQVAVTRVKARIYEQWLSTGFFQSKERKDLWRLAKVVGDIENELLRMVEDSHLEEE